MSVVHPEAADLAQFLAGYDSARREVIGLLRSLTVSTGSIPDSEWTVREAAVHLIGVSRLYRQFLHGIASPIRGSWAELPVLNAGYFLALDEADPRELARLLDEAAAGYAHDAALLDALQPCPWHLGQTLDVATEVALETSELLMHGWDIANTIGRRLCHDEAATTALSGMRWLWAATVPPDPNRAEATLAVSVSGERQLVFTLHPGGATAGLPQAGERYDCTVDGSPFALLLWLWSRVGWADAGLDISGSKPEVGRTFRA